MNILAFDTCFDACSVAVGIGLGQIEPRPVVLGRFERMTTGQASRLMPMMAEVMAEAGVGFEDLDRIAVTIGPGTFTGTRIGIAAARALALSSGLPVVAPTSLAVMAQAAFSEAAEVLEHGLLAVVTDARRGEVYVQLFCPGPGPVMAVPKSDPAVMSLAAVTTIGGTAPIVYVGSGAEAAASQASRQGRAARHLLADLQPDAKSLVRIAVHSSPLTGSLLPLYLRPPDAKPPADPALQRA